MVRWTWWAVVVIAVGALVIAVASSPRNEAVRRDRTPLPTDTRSNLQPVPPWLVAVDAAGRRLQPSVILEDELYVIRCPGYVTEAYAPRDDDELPLRLTLAPGGSLRGRVVLGSEAHPAVGARVELYSWPDSHTTRTDQNGRFELPDLHPADALFPDVCVPGYLPPELFCQAGEEILVVLGDGGTLRGKLVGVDGAPVAGMRVTLHGHMQHSAEVDGERFGVVSDANGAFEFHGLGGFEYRVVASDQTHYGEAQVPSSEEENGDQPCMVVVSERPRLRIRILAPDGAPIEDARIETAGGPNEFPRYFPRMAPGVYISGPLALGTQEVVVRVDGWPVRFIKAQLQRVEEREIEVRLTDAHTVRVCVTDDTGRPVEGASAWTETSAARTDAEGRFDIRGLGPEPVTLTVEHEGHTSVSATVAPSEVEHRITIPRAATLTGRIEPIPAVRSVSCRFFSTEIEFADARVDVFGRFAFRGLPVGKKFDITFQVQDWIGVPLRGMTLAPGEVRDVGVLHPPVAATLKGVVRDSRGQELGGVSMVLKSRMQDVNERRFTNEYGVYQFSVLVSQSAKLEVFRTGLVGRTFELELAGRQVLDIVLVRFGLLTGTAKGAKELRLVPVQDGQPLDWAPADDGTFSVNAAPGHYRLEYRLAGEWTLSRLVDVFEGEQTSVAVAVSSR